MKLKRKEPVQPEYILKLNQHELNEIIFAVYLAVEQYSDKTQNYDVGELKFFKKMYEELNDARKVLNING